MLQLQPRVPGWRKAFRIHRLWLIALAAAVVCFAAYPNVPARSAQTPAINVFAAASLTEVFTVLGKILEGRWPGIRVTFNFAGSQQLALQIEQGARADVFASADQRWMRYVQERGLVLGAPWEFARNRLAIIVPQSNPAGIARLQDLAHPGVKVVIEADAVPAGHYAREALAKLSAAPGFDPDYAARVLANVVSNEDNVKAVVTKVLLGEADAGIVYRSDVTPKVAGRVKILEIPEPYNVEATYPIAILKGAQNLGGARQFVDLVLSPMGRQVLRDSAFLP